MSDCSFERCIQVKLNLFPTECPTTNAPILENKDPDGRLTVLELDLASFDKVVGHQLVEIEETSPKPELLKPLAPSEALAINRIIALKDRCAWSCGELCGERVLEH